MHQLTLEFGDDIDALRLGNDFMADPEAGVRVIVEGMGVVAGVYAITSTEEGREGRQGR